MQLEPGNSGSRPDMVLRGSEAWCRRPGQDTGWSWLSELSDLAASYLFVLSLKWLGCKVCC